MKKSSFKRLLSLILAIIMLISALAVFGACKKDIPENQKSPADRIKDKETAPTFLFSYSDVEITGGDRFRIVPKFSEGAGITYDKIQYTVAEGEDIVSIDGYYVTGKKGGTATILAEYIYDWSVYSTFTVKVDMKGDLYKISDYVYASQKGGMYSKAFSLTLEPSSENYTIYYTLDCSVPTNKSKKYTEPFNISDKTNTSTYPLTKSVLGEPIDGAGHGKSSSGAYRNNIERTGNYPKVGCGMVITYSVYDGNKLLETSSVTYIVKKNAEDYFTIPVICLSMPYDDWFDNEEGIYNICYHDLKARAYMEYYDLTTGESFKINTSVKVGGGYSRGYPKKTLNLNFKKDENGNKNAPTDVAIFGEATMDGDQGSLLSAICRLRLHNSGNTYESGNMFGDAFFQRLVEGTNCSTAAYRPCL
ncbi:MAG: chitobiase/beta-hexosaminidase C-terminal domain-containing protein, partial [Clostridia bacterium]|nr:chitobiase/beta-hexosaminidase C-terminal domain-containing protein [Clostridia bacterium]